MTINRTREEIMAEGLQEFRDSRVKKFLPDLSRDVKDLDGNARAERSIAGIQDFLTPEDRLHNLVNSNRTVGLKSLKPSKAEQTPLPPIAPLKEKSFAQSMFGLFNQITKKTAKKSDEYKPKGPGKKL